MNYVFLSCLPMEGRGPEISFAHGIELPDPDLECCALLLSKFIEQSLVESGTFFLCQRVLFSRNTLELIQEDGRKEGAPP